MKLLWVFLHFLLSSILRVLAYSDYHGEDQLDEQVRRRNDTVARSELRKYGFRQSLYSGQLSDLDEGRSQSSEDGPPAQQIENGVLYERSLKPATEILYMDLTAQSSVLLQRPEKKEVANKDVMDMSKASTNQIGRHMRNAGEGAILRQVNNIERRTLGSLDRSKKYLAQCPTGLIHDCRDTTFGGTGYCSTRGTYKTLSYSLRLSECAGCRCIDKIRTQSVFLVPEISSENPQVTSWQERPNIKVVGSPIKPILRSEKREIACSPSTARHFCFDIQHGGTGYCTRWGRYKLDHQYWTPDWCRACQCIKKYKGQKIAITPASETEKHIYKEKDLRVRQSLLKLESVAPSTRHPSLQKRGGEVSKLVSANNPLLQRSKKYVVQCPARLAVARCEDLRFGHPGLGFCNVLGQFKLNSDFFSTKDCPGCKCVQGKSLEKPKAKPPHGTKGGASVQGTSGGDQRGSSEAHGTNNEQSTSNKLDAGKQQDSKKQGGITMTHYSDGRIGPKLFDRPNRPVHWMTIPGDEVPIPYTMRIVNCPETVKNPNCIDLQHGGKGWCTVHGDYKVGTPEMGTPDPQACTGCKCVDKKPRLPPKPAPRPSSGGLHGVLKPKDREEPQTKEKCDQKSQAIQPRAAHPSPNALPEAGYAGKLLEPKRVMPLRSAYKKMSRTHAAPGLSGHFVVQCSRETFQSYPGCTDIQLGLGGLGYCSIKGEYRLRMKGKGATPRLPLCNDCKCVENIEPVMFDPPDPLKSPPLSPKSRPSSPGSGDELYNLLATVIKGGTAHGVYQIPAQQETTGETGTSREASTSARTGKKGRKQKKSS